VEKDLWAAANQFAQQVQDKFGVLVKKTVRDGENFEFTFDRDLTLENLEAIKTLMSTSFPNHKIVEKTEESGT
jgi:hypothetical protein